MQKTGKATQLKSYKVALEPNQTYSYCTCGLSSNQPFCDGSHAGSEFQPLNFTVAESKTYAICGCRIANNLPFCDGAHKTLIAPPEPISDTTLDKITKLQAKYNATGQDLNSYLEGLLHTDYLTYWDYIQLDTLLSLQKPKTNIPDEKIFIIYHQITELYFTLILNEIKQLTNATPTIADFEMRMQRINNYFDHLINSFEVMLAGMDKQQFLNFRMALLPASGFQSAQYRMIELWSTNCINLVQVDKRSTLAPNTPAIECYPFLYWKQGASELATGKKTFTLLQFEQKYETQFLALITEAEQSNLAKMWDKMTEIYPTQDLENLKQLLRQHDQNTNVRWPLMHYKSAARYLEKKPEDIAATGGTNWQKYLPPKNQIKQFYPTLWNDDEQENWGKHV
jgi:tryptophan 2,3-dioxygenase